jgi:hypothetical protein
MAASANTGAPGDDGTFRSFQGKKPEYVSSVPGFSPRFFLSAFRAGGWLTGCDTTTQPQRFCKRLRSSAAICFR